MSAAVRQYQVREVADLLSLSVREVWRLVAAKKLAAPVKIGRCCRWFESDIVEFQMRLKTERERTTA
jgi:predicted DNA-binding transcriptional regulator AlpA